METVLPIFFSAGEPAGATRSETVGLIVAIFKA